MGQQRGAVGPLLEKHQPQRVLAVDMHGMRDAAGLVARAMHMFEAQFANLVQRYPARAVTLPVTTIMLILPH